MSCHAIALKAPPDGMRGMLPGLVFVRAALHELHAFAGSDGVSATCSALILAQASGPGAVLWVRQPAFDREAGTLYPAGLAELGMDPAQVIYVQARDAVAALQAGLEGARSAAVDAVIVELWGEARAYDLTASRRLALAAKASGVPVFAVRVAADPRPSAAETRWLVRTAASRRLAANAPGHPAFDWLLLRARSGQEGLRYCVEWDRDARNLVCVPAGSARASHDHASLSGAVVSLPANRPGPAQDEPAPWRRAG